MIQNRDAKAYDTKALLTLVGAGYSGGASSRHS